MKGHQLCALRGYQFPIDALLPAEATIARPVRGPHDDWAADAVHTDECCPGTSDQVLLRDSDGEPHTRYRACPHLPPASRARVDLASQLADTYTRQLELCDVRRTKARNRQGCPDTIDDLADLGRALHVWTMTQYDVFVDLRRDLDRTDPHTRSVVLAYLAAREEDLHAACRAFSPRWWGQLTSRPTASRLTFFSSCSREMPDVAASIVAGDLVARGSSWFVVRTPRLQDQPWWDEHDDAMCDLGPASRTLPSALWPTFGDLLTAARPREAFDALAAAGQ